MAARPADENHFEISKDTTDCSVAANQPDNLPLSLFFLPTLNAIVVARYLLVRMNSFLSTILAIVAILLTAGCEAFTIGSGGMASRRELMEMRAVGKRGKVPSPPRLRHDYSRRADERDWNSDTFEEHREGTAGVPALNLFVRGRHSHSEWMPAGNVVPDDATVHLINYYRDTGSDTARKELDDIIAKSLAG